MSHLEKLKAKRSHPGEPLKVPKEIKPENMSVSSTVKTAKSTFDSKGSPRGRRFSENINCPARYKRTGDCIGRAYFEGKAGAGIFLEL